MIINPFIEGLICVLVAVGCFVLGTRTHAPELTDLGKLLVGAGIGYIGGARIGQATNGAKNASNPNCTSH